ncbi:hypothetical protein STENM223S_06720 [Streptomyces tendae]
MVVGESGSLGEVPGSVGSSLPGSVSESVGSGEDVGPVGSSEVGGSEDEGGSCGEPVSSGLSSSPGSPPLVLLGPFDGSPDRVGAGSSEVPGVPSGPESVGPADVSRPPASSEGRSSSWSPSPKSWLSRRIDAGPRRTGRRASFSDVAPEGHHGAEHGDEQRARPGGHQVAPSAKPSMLRRPCGTASPRLAAGARGSGDRRGRLERREGRVDARGRRHRRPAGAGHLLAPRSRPRPAAGDADPGGGPRARANAPVAAARWAGTGVTRCGRRRRRERRGGPPRHRAPESAPPARRWPPMITPSPVASQESSSDRSSTRSPTPSSTAECRTVRASAALRTSRRPPTTSSAWSPLMCICAPRRASSLRRLCGE